MELAALITIFAGVLFFALVLYIVVRTRYKKAGPDEALIVFGRRKLLGRKVRSESGEVEGFRIIRGGGTFVWPAWEQYELLSLRMMTLDIDLRHVYTAQGIPINVKAVAQVKVQGDIEHIRRAAEGFLGIPADQIQATIKETVAGHLRGIIGTLTVEELYRDQKSFQEKVREEAHRDLDGMGFEFRSFVFQAIQDDEGYLNALGQPKIQEALKNARIATANADRDAAIEEEQARQQKEQKKILVNTQIAESDKALSLKKASIKKEVDIANAQALKAEGIAKAEAESTMRREIGLAEAKAIRAKGEAEAEARRLLAEALKLYNEAGLSIEALKVLPEIAAAVSEPLARAGETTIISNGAGPGDGTGAARLTDDVVQVLSQLSPIMEQLAGVDIKGLLRDISKLPAAVAGRSADAGGAGEVVGGKEER